MFFFKSLEFQSTIEGRLYCSSQKVSFFKALARIQCNFKQRCTRTMTNSTDLLIAQIRHEQKKLKHTNRPSPLEIGAGPPF